MKFYTWIDIDIFFQKKIYNKEIPDYIIDIRTYYDGIEVFLADKEYEDDFKNILCDLFLDWYDKDKNAIYLESFNKNNFLPIFFEYDNYINIKKEKRKPKPFFGDITLFPDNISSKDFDFPAIIDKEIKLFSFYSFKGGVGRTLHLIAAAKAILEKQLQTSKLLIVDADLEAPGLTWWARQNKESPDFSFLDFISLANYDSSNNFEHTLELAAKSLKEVPINFGKSSCYFLPAFRSKDQLMRFPLRPENLIKSLKNDWVVGDLLFYLGKKLGANFILVDLRAGLSELSSPLLFDPRIIKIFVTTFSKQSIEGTELTLSQVAKIAPPFELVNNNTYYDPTLIFSMVPEELTNNEDFNETIENMVKIYPDIDLSDAVTPTRISYVTTFFAQELLHLDSLQSTLDKLEGKLLFKKVDEVISKYLESSQESEMQILSKSDIVSKLRDLEKVCGKFEYAETGSGRGFLPIKSIIELGLRFSQSIPLAVVIGSKGTGKTHLFMQLMYCKTWMTFLHQLEAIYGNTNLTQNISDNLYFYPLIEASSLKDGAALVTNEIRREIGQKLGNTGLEWTKIDLLDAIREAISANTAWHVSDWRRFWVSSIGKMLGLSEEQGHEWIEMKQIQDKLKSLDLSVVVVIDGLEELFQEIRSSIPQQLALRGLLELPIALREFRENRLGLICFARKDIVRAAIKQNSGQFENLYGNFALTWSMEDALRLVLWICYKANIIGLTVDTILQLSIDDLTEKLYSIWGRKLGSDASNEAYTANWVLAVLSDYNGQLLARDLVRFIKNAAEKSKKAVNYNDRLLQPVGIRSAIEPCSIKKIEEYEQEFAELKPLFDKLKSFEQSLKRIPFTQEKLKLVSSEIEALETAGVIQEMNSRYYMHEIFRHGLGFTLEKGARPKVLAMKRKFFSK